LRSVWAALLFNLRHAADNQPDRLIRNEETAKL